MGKNFLNSIKVKAPTKSAFDLSHDVKLSCNMGELVPTLAMECVPGDKINLSTESLLRFQPLIAPMMHRCNVYHHYFFVPNRILWPNWEKYITNGGPQTDALPAFPKVTVNFSNYTNLHDYMGIPMPADGKSASISAFPFAAFQRIWWEYYRDQNLTTYDMPVLTDGDNTGNDDLRAMRKRCWEHDYFTAALPWAQRGEQVTLPLTNIRDIPVYVNRAATGIAGWLDDDGNTVAAPEQSTVDNPPISGNTLYADTSTMQAEAATINDLRTAFRLQEWLEKAARGGARYFENILNFFNVKSPDARLQRPEYITGAVSPVVISEVLNTTGTDDAPQGNMSGHAVAVTSGDGGSYFCQEHGYIIGIMSIMPKTAYQQGIPRHFLKTNDPMEFAWPQFAHLGEQPVYNQELYAYEDDAMETFGYLPKYAEYKVLMNRVAGDFRTSLNTWHMGRIFETPPALNESFTTSDPTERVFAVTDPGVQHMLCQVYHKINAIRPLPKFGTPSF